MASSSAEADIKLQSELATSVQPEELPLVSGLTCVICGKGQPAYKCPTCYAKYCSVICCKSHKSEGGTCEGTKPKQEAAESGNSNETTRNYYYPTKDTVPIDQLQMLSQGDNLVQLKKFLEDPTIRSNILKLDTCSDPISEFAEVMEDENFVKFSAFITNQLNKDPPNVRRDLE